MVRDFIFAALLLGLGFTCAKAQPLAKRSEFGAYAVPFASESNHIELEVVNSTDDALDDVTVQMRTSPTWLTFATTTAPVGSLKPGEERLATFIFDQDEKAPVGEVASIEFDVLSSAGLAATRAITIEPEAPKELTLRGNYPNPFNPSTKIAYALPSEANVEIEIYNAIGQRVTRLVDNLQTAGYQEASWNATTFPSGVYFYSISMKTKAERSVKFGKMLLVK